MDSPLGNEDPPLRLVAGLGNPGAKYQGTRHNVGFAVVEELARRAGSAFRNEPKWNAEIAENGSLTWMKPLTFMNLSGESVGDFFRFYKLAFPQVLVVIDDVSLPLGTIRIRRSGSAGGHNGLESVMVHLSTEQVPRLRVGIGAPDQEMTGHVLGKFSQDQQEIVGAAIGRAVDAIETIRERGIDAAMNLFNPKQS